MPGNYDISIYQGDYFELPLELKQSDGVTPVNLTGHTGLGQIRAAPESGDVEAVITVTITNASQGHLTASMSSAVTAAIELPDTVKGWMGGVYDIQTTDGSGKVTTWLAGVANVRKQVTR